MAKKQKFYVVWQGLKPGIYNSWTDCQLQIKGVASARYKSFKTLKEAELAFEMGPGHEVKPEIEAQTPCLTVDAACAGNPGLMEYRGVALPGNKEVFKKGPYPKGTNNIGEFLAIVHGLALCKQKNKPDLPIYTDSRTAMSWVKKKQCRTNLQFDSVNQDLLELIKRAEAWLKTNTYSNPILKWETKSWGEIPADFGRK
ncbi:ribonuclease H family protein [Flavobacteriaceae bacterium]|nr:ribonuclease H family protein [Flavobacteriaceae bacterium]